jgi:hypothetical protein
MAEEMVFIIDDLTLLPEGIWSGETSGDPNFDLEDAGPLTPTKTFSTSQYIRIMVRPGFRECRTSWKRYILRPICASDDL